MHRFAYSNIVHWKNSPRRKPLIIRGARQVGKTFLVREFERKNFPNTVEVNFDWNLEKMSAAVTTLLYG
ncbi:MAG: AAA family ATPase [Opitutae bacterium]|nr:AAA family ATPase [Opitutae bacterium]